MTLHFSKMHGIGNDFVVLDNSRGQLSLPTHFIRQLADRHYGVGCDQVLVVDPAPRAGVDFGYRIFNADGSPSGQCGNGARCLAQFIHEQQLSDKSILTLATSHSELQLQRLSDGQVRVSMGVPNWDPSSLPLKLPQQSHYALEIAGLPVTFSALSLGNPHAVIIQPQAHALDVQAIGRAFNAHPAFPKGVNVGFLEILTKDQMKLRVYERGAGETLACGSGACAAMVAAHQQGDVGTQATVHLPGGELMLEWGGGNAPVYMTGPAVTVYHGTWQGNIDECSTHP